MVQYRTTLVPTDGRTVAFTAFCNCIYLLTYLYLTNLAHLLSTVFEAANKNKNVVGDFLWQPDEAFVTVHNVHTLFYLFKARTKTSSLSFMIVKSKETTTLKFNSLSRYRHIQY